jgi:hypothetical protein
MGIRVKSEYLVFVHSFHFPSIELAFDAEEKDSGVNHCFISF